MYSTDERKKLYSLTFPWQKIIIIVINYFIINNSNGGSSSKSISLSLHYRKSQYYHVMCRVVELRIL
jgi:hypothetical protein